MVIIKFKKLENCTIVMKVVLEVENGATSKIIFMQVSKNDWTVPIVQSLSS